MLGIVFHGKRRRREGVRKEERGKREKKQRKKVEHVDIFTWQVEHLEGDPSGTFGATNY
jgi:hypothetical protein